MSGIIVIGATNFAESLDSALLRPGRFDKHVSVPLPDVGGRKEILEMYSTKTKIAPDVDLGILARGTTGFSGADLYNLMNQAAVKASVDGLDAITMSVFEWAKDKILMGAERKSAVITPETAGHEDRACHGDEVRVQRRRRHRVLRRGHGPGGRQRQDEGADRRGREEAHERRLREGACPADEAREEAQAARRDPARVRDADRRRGEGDSPEGQEAGPAGREHRRRLEGRPVGPEVLAGRQGGGQKPTNDSTLLGEGLEFEDVSKFYRHAGNISSSPVHILRGGDMMVGPRSTSLSISAKDEDDQAPRLDSA
ncbi:hypothetical protein THAOC_08930, partial [Thalassiosira oceanica]